MELLIKGINRIRIDAISTSIYSPLSNLPTNNKLINVEPLIMTGRVLNPPIIIEAYWFRACC